MGMKEIGVGYPIPGDDAIIPGATTTKLIAQFLTFDKQDEVF